MDGRRRGRIIVSLPVHPFVMMFYLILALPLLLIAQFAISRVFTYLGVGLPGLFIAFNMVFLSLLLSPFNIVLKEVGTGIYTVKYETRYVLFFGIPIPIVDRRIVENKVLIAINVGGAIIPLFISTIIVLGLLLKSPSTLVVLFIAIAITALITYKASRPISGVGIAVPTFIPPIVAAITATLLIHPISLAVPASYVIGTLGCLIGADILRFLKDRSRLMHLVGPTILSIGGAGTFDGIYLSGIIATLLTLIIT